MISLADLDSPRAIEDALQTHAPTVLAALDYGARPDVSAADVHFRVGAFPWVKVGGQLKPIEELSVPSAAEIELAIEWFGGPETSETVRYPLGTSQRWRGQTMVSNDGPAITARRLPTVIPALSDLGESLIGTVQQPSGVSKIPQIGEGLVIVAGATGSGKSTTLAAIINEINLTRACHVYTIENPIEIVYHSDRALFTQREVGSHTPSAAQAFNAALRSAPDVILVSEIRTEEEFDLCLEAAMSGHLVLTTMHARDAGTVFERIVGTRGEFARSKLAQAIRMVISQRLIVDARDVKVRHVFAEVVSRDLSGLLEIIRSGAFDKVNAHIANATGGGLDYELAKAVHQNLISRGVAKQNSIDPSQFEKRYERLSS